jgi:hypothetical protein
MQPLAARGVLPDFHSRVKVSGERNWQYRLGAVLIFRAWKTR